MEAELDILPINSVFPNGFYSKGFKRIKMSTDRKDFSASIPNETERSKPKISSKVIDHSDPLSIPNLLDGLDSGKFGSVSKDIEHIMAQRRKMLHRYLMTHPTLSNKLLDVKKRNNPEVSKLRNQQSNYFAQRGIIAVDDENVACETPAAAQAVVIIDSDEEEDGYQKPPSYPFQEIVLMRQSGQLPMDMVLRDHAEINAPRGEEKRAGEIHTSKDKGMYVGVEEEEECNTTDAENDGLDDIWKEMKMSLEFSQDSAADLSSHEQGKENGEDCDHSFVLKDDLGYVCRVCGVIDRGIETIFEFQYNKGKRSTRTYVSDYRNAKDKDSNDTVGVKLSVEDLMVTEVCAHPRHMKQMKPHQVEGFNFLVSNLVSDNPGGCILAHAPGSGKTFMIISFMQSFLAKYPHARPLVVLPKGILATWKKEFQTWQVEDIPLLDFYTVKADNRSQQLEVLKQWVEQKSILFLGYKQLSTIVCESSSNNISASCQEILLKAPSILILDEGHTPRNENTNVLQSLAKVQTPRKVVLSGTLYQNHVKEVFNILNLVRPKFLRIDTSRTVVKRILSRVHISGLRKQFKGGVDAAFFELVEHTLQKDEDFRRKVTIIQDLREMTSKVLHYYKGDFLDELPGLHDFTVLLNLSPRQTKEVQKLRKLQKKFKVSAVGSAVYVHPYLSSVSENSVSADHKVDEMLENMNVSDGVKAKFFLNMVNLCDSTGEKLLVFSPYLLPLKFLERLAVKTKGWSLGKEIFVISGESSSEQREWSMDRFNNSPDSKVFFGSIKACGEGISLVGASRVIILDVHLNPSVTRQAIGRAFRPGQKKKVFTYRLVAANSPEEEDHSTCFKKELIAKMWFEWNEYCGFRDFDVETVDMTNCGDLFLESPLLREDIKQLYKR